jgi:hypothetical protein
MRQPDYLNGCRKLEPADEFPSDDPTDVSCRLEPIEEGVMVDPTLESEMLDPIVDR